MAADTVISVENLSKRYVIGHQTRHDTLRDALVHGVRRLGRLLVSGERGLATGQEEFWALRDVSFEVRRGEVLGIIGRNGAGKSTLLKILSRITEPTGGRAAIRGRVASLLEVGTGFHPELTGRENIFLNGAILGMGRLEIRRKFDEIVAFAEVERFLDTPVKHYSSGMYVRLAFAVAAHLEPEILVVDEVLAVGDAQFQARCLGKMESIAQNRGRTVLFVSHNLSAVVRLCQRALVLDEGLVTADGSAATAVGQYLGTRAVKPGARLSLSQDGWRPEAPVRLTAVAVNEGAAVMHRQPMRATIHFDVLRPVKEAGFGLGVSGLDGRRILTLESDYHGTFFELAAAGPRAVTLALPSVDLAPGRYSLDVGAYDERHRAFHYAPAFATLEVEAAAGTAAHLHGELGDYRPAADWRLSS